MTKDKALHAWFSQFLTAYPTSNVPEDATFPWLTYELITGALDSGEISLTVNLWYYTESEAIPNAKAQEISTAIGYGGTVIPCCQNIADETDKNIKRRYLNITAEYLTEN